jgi:hypothetical protein
MRATRAVGGQEDIAVVRWLLECLARSERKSVWWIEDVRRRARVSLVRIGNWNTLR